MNLTNFFRRFPNEQSCRGHFYKLRMKQGVICKKCGHTDHYWLCHKEQFQCKQCKFRTTLRSGTVMQSSKLPFQYWYIAMHLLTGTKKSFSALELQHQLGHKFYEPVWAMLHKLRTLMGLADDNYTLEGYVEMDEAFFVTWKEGFDAGPLKSGRGSQRQSMVMVMCSTLFDHKYQFKKPNHKTKSALRFAKMKIMENAKSKTIGEMADQYLDNSAIALSDGYRSYSVLKHQLNNHLIDTKDNLRWVHTIIAKAKRTFLGIFHSIKDKYLQLYLNEFCYKLNRRGQRDKIFDLLSFSAAKSLNFV
jgi:transposase-like protein